MIRKSIIILILILSVGIGASADTRNNNNPYGMMLMSGGDAHTAGMLLHYKLARDFCGEWGYVRTGTSIDKGSIDEYVRTVVGLRAMHLIPVLTAFRLPESYYKPGNQDDPKRDPDGSLTTFGKAYEEWARELYSRGITIPYFEYGNEVNGGFYGGSPETYAEMCIAVSKALKRVDPEISFGTAGMAGCGDDYYDELLTKVPDLKNHVDHWGLHPYAANHPPQYTEELGNYGLGSHKWTEKVLKKHGVKNPIFIMTETGYELGNEKDGNFPKITDELRRDYLVYGFKNIWEPDPSVRGVMPFMLMDVRWHGWNGWDFIREDFTTTPMYDAICKIPKPKGKDYLPSGPCTVKGKITDSALGRPVEGYLVWVRIPFKGCYAGVTDANGSYTIANIPTGTYDISGYCDGFSSTSVEKVTLKAGEPVSWSKVVNRHGLMSIADTEGRMAPGWSPINGKDVYSMDTAAKRSGSSSQRITANGSEIGIWNITGYESCLPNHVYNAEVWVKTKGLVLGKGQGVQMRMVITDSFNRDLASAGVRLSGEGDRDWTPLTVAFKSVPQGRRIKLQLLVDAEKGDVWFDDLFLHDAAWPLPSAMKVNGTNTIKGVVFGPDGQKRLAGATVCTVPLGQYAVTDWLGRFEVKVPAGTYDVCAFHPEWVSNQVSAVKAPGAAKLSIKLDEPPAPAELQNADFENIPQINTWFTGWNRYGTVEGVSAAGWHKGLPEHPEGFQPHSGKGFYGAVAGSNIKDGGIFQTIAVEPDALYEVSVWSYTWQSDDGSRGDVANRLGVDPMGGKDSNSPYVIWTPYRASHKKWSRIALQVRPVKSKMTIYLNHLQVQGLVFNCNLFDDLEVKKIGPAEKTMASGE